MTKPQTPAGSDAEADASATDMIKPVPDEDGPHDVPDDKVIEKTLPAKTVPRSRSPGPQ